MTAFLLGFSTVPPTGTSSGRPRIQAHLVATGPTARSPAASVLRQPDGRSWPYHPDFSPCQPSFLPSDHATRRRRRAHLFSGQHSVSRQEAAAATSLPHLGRSGAALPIRYAIAAPLALLAHLWLLLSILPHADLCARLLMLCVLFCRRNGRLAAPAEALGELLGAAQGLWSWS